MIIFFYMALSMIYRLLLLLFFLRKGLRDVVIVVCGLQVSFDCIFVSLSLFSTKMFDLG